MWLLYYVCVVRAFMVKITSSFRSHAVSNRIDSIYIYFNIYAEICMGLNSIAWKLSSLLNGKKRCYLIQMKWLPLWIVMHNPKLNYEFESASDGSFFCLVSNFPAFNLKMVHHILNVLLILFVGLFFFVLCIFVCFPKAEAILDETHRINWIKCETFSDQSKWMGKKPTSRLFRSSSSPSTQQISKHWNKTSKWIESETFSNMRSSPIQLSWMFYSTVFVILLSVINDKLKSKIEWKTLLNCSSFIIIYFIFHWFPFRSTEAQRPKTETESIYCGWHTNLFINT